MKLIGIDGTIQYMNYNGLCAMQIEDFSLIAGRPWSELWPDVARTAIEESYAPAAAGEAVAFKAFCPTAQGEERWWDVSVTAVSNDDGAHVGYLAVSRDITHAETGREALEIAASELKHRLKNTYTIIGSLLMSFARGNPANETFAEEMSTRLQALSTAQLLFASTDASCEVNLLLPVLLDPFSNPACPVVIDAIPPRSVDQGQADAIALIMGELAVNSSKHGALAHGGELHIGSGSREGPLTIVWRERSDVPVTVQARDGGQGIRLMQRIAKARRGALDLVWNGFGLTATLVFRD